MAGRRRESALACSLLLAACSGAGVPDLSERAPDQGDAGAAGAGALRLPFAVDDHFHPTGCMSSEGTCAAARSAIDTRRCLFPRPHGAQGQCYRFTLQPLASFAAGEERFAGWLWQYDDHNWGERPGLRVERGASRVRFRAASTRGAGAVRFRAGGTNYPRQADPALVYQDTFLEELEVELTPELARYEIPLAGASYDRVLSAFGWVFIDRGMTEPLEFVVDDVRWE